MNLQELLSHTTTYLDDRTENLIDGDPDSLWSDATILRYLNEAQRILCRRAWVIIDIGNPTAGMITLAEGVSTYALHTSVIRLYDGTVESETPSIPRYTDAALRAPRSPSLEAFDINRSETYTPGAPIAVASDAGSRLVRVIPAPAAAQTGTRVLLKVARMPIVYLTLDDTEASPEVPEEYHMGLCDYAAGRCLTQPNVDGQAKTDGRILLAGFDNLVIEARRERQRAEMAPARFAFASTTART